MKLQYTIFGVLLTMIIFNSSTSWAKDQSDPTKLKTEINRNDSDISPQWAMGIGVGYFEYLLYPGAKKAKNLILPAPYFTYRSPSFEIDRGIKSFLYNSETIVLDISADFGLPVDSDESTARRGMPDLDFMLQVGPSIEFLLNGRSTQYFDARFELPLRVAVTSDLRNVENIGYLMEPRLSFNHRRTAKTGISQKITLGLKFATQDFHAYYYDVQQEFVTPERSLYKSDAGFGGSFLKYRLSYKTNDFVYWAFLRYQSLRGAEFENSPLVLKNDYYFAGLGFSWIFASSL